MKWHRLSAGAVLMLLTALTLPQAASAATRSGPDTARVSCSASDVWLKLSASGGASCYTGRGTLVVSLTGVTGGQVFGLHQACLTFTTGGTDCVTGPGRFVLNRPANVRLISLT